MMRRKNSAYTAAMRIFSPRCTVLFFLFSAPFFLSTTAFAQSGVEMLLKPWDWAGKQEADLSGGGGQTHTHDKANSNASESIQYGLFQGRVHTEGMPFMVGWSVKTTSFGSDARPDVPQMMHDASVSLATSLSPSGPAQMFGYDWDLAAQVGVGHASTDWADANGYYGIATLTAGTNPVENSRLIFGLSYDSNRSFLEHVPLPGFEYRQFFIGDGSKQKPEFAFRVGFPRTGVTWRPDEDWFVDVSFDSLNLLFAGRVEYEIPADRFWHVFVQYKPYITRVHDAEVGKRLFFSENTAEIGVRYAPRPRLNLIAAVGYSMDQKLERGKDSTSLQTVHEFADAPTFRGEIRWEF